MRIRPTPPQWGGGDEKSGFYVETTLTVIESIKVLLVEEKISTTYKQRKAMISIIQD
jgi:hypothetical protein